MGDELALSSFNGCEQNACGDAETAIQLIGSIHAEVEVQFIGEGIEILFEVCHAIGAEGDVVILGDEVGKESAQESQPHAVFK